MTPERIARLTPRQRACLRLVWRHRTSKEIAHRLGLAPGSVDQHLKAAMRTLGVRDRRVAARMLAEAEEADAYQKLVLQSPDVAAAPGAAPSPDATERGRRGESGPTVLREEQRAYLVSPARPLRSERGGPDGLNWAARLKWIAAIAMGTALAFGVLLSAMAALARVFRG